MKKVVLILVCIVFLTNCGTSDNLPVTEKFNLINVSGGFAGVNENFDKGQIIWTLNEQNSTLTVEKNTDRIFSGLSAGTYSYVIQNSNNGLFIYINNTERGSVTTSNNGMIIDENVLSSGSGADGFVYQFEK